MVSAGGVAAGKQCRSRSSRNPYPEAQDALQGRRRDENRQRQQLILVMSKGVDTY